MTHQESSFEEVWDVLEKTLGHRFHDRGLLREALTHRSYANERLDASRNDNERLEFLGDAVLDLVVGRHLHLVQPPLPEGEMTRIRAEVVAETGLARIARELGIGSALLLGRGEERSAGRRKSSLLANALEALFGAVFVDGGFEAAENVILPLVAPQLQLARRNEGPDFKSRLQELLQGQRRGLPEYRVVAASGPAHQRHYRVEVLVGGVAAGCGEGHTKKRAEQAAAQVALAGLAGDA